MELLTHYYKRGSRPFRSLRALPESEAIQVMEELCDESPLFARFKEPVQYLQFRKRNRIMGQG
ncbi:hypothetical protein [Paenibacillus sp. J2TS4]|uniref:hypothetical protein n=1 Tax=Paenibacillus sp. J2TS4 TaxID=2807194 RepID=UPI001BCBF3FB|nr:hypothetical protein [Paenibacillus sp. J2TS4]